MNLLTDTSCNSKSVQDKLLETLEDIAHKVRIQDDISIHHPAYEPFELPKEISARFQQLPQELRNKYLGLRLRNFLYRTYYDDSMKPGDGLDTPEFNLENNTHRDVDLKFYEQLHANNMGAGYFDPSWQVIKQEEDGSLAVFKLGLTIHVDRVRYLLPTEQTATEGDIVSIRMPKNLIQSGGYVAVGNEGPSKNETVEIYFNVSSEGTVCLLKDLTERLNKARIPFSLKALYNPSEYKCCNPLTLCFSRKAYSITRKVLQQIYSQYAASFQPQIPLFTKLIAPGLGLAEDPETKHFEQENFGQHRCQAIADGLIEAWQKGDTTRDGRMDSILHHLDTQGIALQYPHLNADSDDIYVPLEIPRKS